MILLLAGWAGNVYIDVNENECVNIGLRLRSNNNGTYNPAHLLPVGSKTAFKYSRDVAAVSAPGSFICALPAWGDAFSSVSPCAPQVMKSYWAKFPTVLRSVAKELNAKAKGKYRFQLESADLKRLQPWLAKQVVRVHVCLNYLGFCQVILAVAALRVRQEPLHCHGQLILRSARVVEDPKALCAIAQAQATDKGGCPGTGLGHPRPVTCAVSEMVYQSQGRTHVPTALLVDQASLPFTVVRACSCELRVCVFIRHVMPAVACVSVAAGTHVHQHPLCCGPTGDVWLRDRAGSICTQR